MALSIYEFTEPEIDIIAPDINKNCNFVVERKDKTKENANLHITSASDNIIIPDHELNIKFEKPDEYVMSMFDMYGFGDGYLGDVTINSSLTLGTAMRVNIYNDKFFYSKDWDDHNGDGLVFIHASTLYNSNTSQSIIDNLGQWEINTMGYKWIS